MSEKFVQLNAYFTYWLDAVDAHSLQSPFFYDLYTNVIQSKEIHTNFPAIEAIRNTLLNDERAISVSDLGSGSQTLRHSSRRIKDIARTSLSSVKFASLYARLITHYKCQHIFELGTSFGINTLYLASTGGEVTTFEGSPEIAAIAHQSFKAFSNSTINLIEGNIDHTLKPALETIDKMDMAFIDANHRYTPTLRYFEWLLSKSHHHTIFILDDIHHSHEMERAWTELKQHKSVHASADLYRCGLLFLNPSLNNQHVILQH